VTGTFFNSAWKYRERAFRYLLLDSEHLVEKKFYSGTAGSGLNLGSALFYVVSVGPVKGSRL
jgi:hypothetical protein